MLFFFLTVIVSVAAVYHGINFLLLFKESMPAILVFLLMGISFLIALPFVPYASIYSTWGKINPAYTVTFLLLYTVFVGLFGFAFWFSFSH